MRRAVVIAAPLGAQQARTGRPWGTVKDEGGQAVDRA